MIMARRRQSHQGFFFCELLKQGIDVDILALTVIVIIMCSGLMIGWRHVDVVMKATALDHLKDEELSGNSGRSQVWLGWVTRG